MVYKNREREKRERRREGYPSVIPKGKLIENQENKCGYVKYIYKVYIIVYLSSIYKVFVFIYFY